MFLNLIFILILNENILSEIVLPIYPLSQENYKLYNNINITKQQETINSFQQSQFYTTIQVGYPFQTIPLLIKLEPNLLIISSINSKKIVQVICTLILLISQIPFI